MDYTEKIIEEVFALGNTDLARRQQSFLKAVPGGYGEGDKFIGTTVPQLRGVAKKYAKLTGLGEISALLDSPWHDLRFVALVLLNRLCAVSANIFPFERRKLLWSETQTLPVSPEDVDYAHCLGLYLARKKAVNNWDLVDVSAHIALGPAIYHNVVDSKGALLLDNLAGSGWLWTERMSVVSTWYAIKKDEYSYTLRLAKYFLKHKHDLMHKACGWMLREVGKRNRDVLSDFLESYATQMPRTMLRYAIEHYGPAQRAHYMHRL
ncbi:MAG: DNA alkylation repair protein [Deltaproteobacteria bacterium]|nr:DNA alkylation repair protein [Deltaproteobacteria bacterium]